MAIRLFSYVEHVDVAIFAALAGVFLYHIRQITPFICFSPKLGISFFLLLEIQYFLAILDSSVSSKNKKYQSQNATQCNATPTSSVFSLLIQINIHFPSSPFPLHHFSGIKLLA